MVAGLAVIGVAFVLLAIWIIRQTRPDLDVLAPLERMGDGDWRKRDPSTQRRMLDEVRPEGAQPLTPEPMAPPLDDEFEKNEHPVSSFSDLGPGVSSDQRGLAPPQLEAEIESGAEPADGEGSSESDGDSDSNSDLVSDLESGSDSEEGDVDSDSEGEVEPDGDGAVDADLDSDEALSDPRG